jgi:hypothetical protein
MLFFIKILNIDINVFKDWLLKNTSKWIINKNLNNNNNNNDNIFCIFFSNKYTKSESIVTSLKKNIFILKNQKFDYNIKILKSNEKFKIYFKEYFVNGNKELESDFNLIFNFIELYNYVESEILLVFENNFYKCEYCDKEFNLYFNCNRHQKLYCPKNKINKNEKIKFTENKKIKIIENIENKKTKKNKFIEKENELTKKENELIERENKIIFKENELNERETQIIFKENELIKKDNEILKKEKHNEQKIKSILKKENKLLEKYNSIPKNTTTNTTNTTNNTNCIQINTNINIINPINLTTKKDKLNHYLSNIIDIDTFIKNYETNQKYQLTYDESKLLLENTESNGYKSFANGLSHYINNKYNLQMIDLLGIDLNKQHILPFINNDLNCRSHLEKIPESWEITNMNDKIKQILIISNKQIYNHHQKRCIFTETEGKSIVNILLRKSNYKNVENNFEILQEKLSITNNNNNELEDSFF